MPELTPPTRPGAPGLPNDPQPVEPTQNAVLDDGGCGSELHDAPADLYRALTRDTGDVRAGAALAVLQNRSSHARTVVQRAISAVAADPFCAHLQPLTRTLEDRAMDDETRGAAALALGSIARDFPCTFPVGVCPTPHNPIPQWSQKALHDCLRTSPAMVARSCAEALGYVSTADKGSLTTVRDDPKKDSLLRLFAGRALTRLTQTQQVTAGSLEALMGDASKVSAK